MGVSPRMVQFIGGHEGFVSTWYLDPVQVPTIGYGFTWGSRVFRDWWMRKYGRKMKRGDTISQADAYQVLQAMIDDEYWPPVQAQLGNQPQKVKDPAASMTYNCGPGALGWKWAQALKRGDLKGAVALWRKTGTTAKGKTLPGLVRRRNEEADIAEFGRYPDDVPATREPPKTRVTDVDIRQAQIWLEQLGYQPGPADGVPGVRTRAATERFQRDHGTLKVDGIIGTATLAALQRSVDLKGKAAGTAAAGGTVAAGGAVETGTGAADQLQTPVGGVGWLGDVLLWGGIAILVIGLAWLAWRYRDELNALVRKL